MSCESLRCIQTLPDQESLSNSLGMSIGISINSSFNDGLAKTFADYLSGKRNKLKEKEKDLNNEDNN